MQNKTIDNFIGEKFFIEVKENINSMNLVFNGELDMQDPETILSPFFHQVHEKMMKESFPRVNMDFKKLYYLNSSGIKTIIKWVHKVSRVEDKQRYQFDFKEMKKFPGNNLHLECSL
ncbi:MAG: hypothetical protein MJB14_17585 [Spirochaetes bacterium]|nr:hypothetical protein [Spirochaetota bacterium]